MDKSPRRKGADALQYIALIGLIILVALGAFRPFEVPAWGYLGLLAIAVGASPSQLTEWFSGIQIVRKSAVRDVDTDYEPPNYDREEHDEFT